MREERLKKKIAVVDFGGQYTHLIARRVRNLGLWSLVVLPDSFDPGHDRDLVGVIWSGGPRSVTDIDSHRLTVELDRIDVPLLGICYGHQLIAAQAGGRIARGRTREYGLTAVQCDPGSTLFEGLSREQTVWMSHGDHVVEAPAGFRTTAWSQALPVAAYESGDGRIFGTQFHPEVTHTVHGLAMLDNFLSRCSRERPWQPDRYLATILEHIRSRTGKKRLFLLVSGGVDSLVTLALCIRAVGPEQVVGLHVDTGLMRRNESEEVMTYLAGLGFENLQVAHEQERFLGQLEGIVDPEGKRRTIGRLFLQVVQEKMAALELDDECLLVQGTIYPDTIESGGTDHAATIKTHHNRVEEIETLIAQGRVLEPLTDLYKDEVRQLGAQLGLPTSLLNRQPFPGPGLAIRILTSGSDPPPAGFDAETEQLRALAEPYGLSGRILAVRSVGVQGDTRTYQHPAVVWTRPGIEADWESLKSCASELVNRLATVNRVVFSRRSLVGKRLALRPTRLDRDQVERLRLVDQIVRLQLETHLDVWQVPVVSLPLYDDLGCQVFVVRPVMSRDAMTADVFELPLSELDRLIASVTAVEGVGDLFYDVTTKPPATIEWE